MKTGVGWQTRPKPRTGNPVNPKLGFASTITKARSPNGEGSKRLFFNPDTQQNSREINRSTASLRNGCAATRDGDDFLSFAGLHLAEQLRAEK